MHPLAHVLVGALVGQAANNPTAAALGGLASHAVLDALPHTEGRSFRSPGPPTLPEFLEAGVEVAAGVTAVAWVVRACPGAHGLAVAAGVLGTLVPDLIDQPLNLLFDVRVLHIPSLHWTVGRRHALWGILTQVVVVGFAAVALWRIASCGLPGL